MRASQSYWTELGGWLSDSEQPLPADLGRRDRPATRRNGQIA
jgi:hypothetical protein